jgi:hypothetical protein
MPAGGEAEEGRRPPALMGPAPAPSLPQCKPWKKGPEAELVALYFFQVNRARLLIHVSPRLTMPRRPPAIAPIRLFTSAMVS